MRSQIGQIGRAGASTPGEAGVGRRVLVAGVALALMAALAPSDPVDAVVAEAGAVRNGLSVESSMVPASPGVRPGSARVLSPSSALNGPVSPWAGVDCGVGSVSMARVSVPATGVEADDGAYNPAVSSDGSTAVFSSYATDLVPDDTNGKLDGFVRAADGTGPVERVTVAADGSEGNSGSTSPRVSGDGSAVAFYSTASNLVGGDANPAMGFGFGDYVYLPNWMLHSTSVSFEAWFRTEQSGPVLGYSNALVGSQPSQAVPAVYVGADGRLRGQYWNGSINPIVSSGRVDDGGWHHVVLTASGGSQRLYLDGSWVGSRSGSINHLSMNRVTVGHAWGTSWPQSGGTGWRSFSGEIDEVSIKWSNMTAAQVAQHFAARTSSYRDTVLAHDPFGYWRLDEPYGTNVAVDVSGNGVNGVISGGFRQREGALTVDENGEADVFVRDRVADTTERISVSSSGEEAVGGFSGFPSIDGTGRFVSFESEASNLVSVDTYPAGNVYVHDRDTGTTELVSVASDGTPANGQSLINSISDDGSVVAFQSWASNLVSGDSNGRADIFVHNRDTGETTLVSKPSTGVAANDDSYAPNISPDGRHVTFYSWASNLVDDDTNTTADVFVVDLETGDIERVSVDDGGVESNGFSGDSSVSSGGRYVAFDSSGTNLVADDTNGVGDVFVRDRHEGTTIRVSVDEAGVEGDGWSGTWSDGSISADGTKIAFDSSATNLVDDDTNGFGDVFVAACTPEPAVGSSDTAGFEGWWSFEQVPLGPAGAASVNVGNGNLVVQHTDTPYVQGHGQLGYVLRRTYNSAGPETVGVIGDGLADGWSFNVTSAGDFGGGAGLVVDGDPSALLELPVTMVDRDGTRHTFVPDGLGLGVTIGTGDGTTFDLVDTIGSLLGGLLGGGENPVPDVLEDLKSLAEGLLAGIPELDLPDLSVCVDTSYASPAGVHMSLWRFVAVSTAASGGCASFGAGDGPGGGAPLILGYGTLTPDRVRQMFSVTGLLISQVDPSGNELRYSYDLEGPAGLRLGRLTDVWEPASCPDGPDTDPTCRALRFTYPGDDVVVTDPGGREVTYTVDSDLLTDVVVRDADDTVVESWGYGYQGHDSVDCAAPAGAMCEVTSPNGAATSFSFDGEGRVTAIADRFDPGDAHTPSQAELTTTLAYGAGETVVERDGKARQYGQIDADLRVGELLEGTAVQVAADEGLRHTTWTWDTPEASCRPDGGVDHHLCSMTRDAGSVDTTGAPAGFDTAGSQTVSYTYNPEGKVLTETVDMGTAGPDLVTTHAYRAAYWEAGSSGDPIVVEDTLAGVHDPRPESGSLYFVSDHTDYQDANGNVYKFRTDDNYDVAPGTLTGTCGRFDRSDQAQSGGGNTGLACHERAPEGYVTSYGYDSFGQRATMVAPNGGTTTYTYFDDTALDLTGSTSAGGWLRAVEDPTGEFVAFGYDRAGNVVRSWDRNATDGQTVGDFPATLAAPPGDFTETRYADGTSAVAFAAPWRWPVAEADQLANLVTLTRDAHGNITTLRPPRGNEADNATFDVTQTFSVRDELLETTTPAGTTGMRYDAWGNAVATVDGNGHATVSNFDAVNRPVSMTRPRGPWADANPTEQARCRQSGAADDPIPAARTVCTTTSAFDGLDQAYAATDPDGATTWMAFDPAGRVVDSWVPRDPGAGEWRHSRQVHDANSNVVLACPPREFDEGPGLCDPGTPARFSTAMVFDGLNRPTTQTRWREAVDTANQGVVTAGWVELTTTTIYDLNAQTVTVDGPRTDVDDTVVSSYDVLDRQVSQTANRDASTVVASTWTYDPSGNIVAMGEGQAGQGADRLTAYRFDAAHRLVDTVEAATSPNAAANDNGFVATEGADPANVRTRNLYDADSNIRAVIGPRGFTASVTNPNLRFMTRTDIDEAGRMVAQWEPYWDNTVTDAALSQAVFQADCPTPSTGHQPAPVASIPAFPSTTGICVIRTAYDPAGNVVRVDNPTAVVPAQDQRFQTFAYTDDNLLASVESPNPAAGDVDARIDTVQVGYDASGRALFTSTPTGRVTTIGGAEQRWVTETAYTPDGLPTLVEQRALTSASAERREERSYDHGGNVVQTDTMISAARTDTTTMAWFSDGMKHQESTTVTGHNAGDVTWRWAYDPAGNATHTWSPSAVAGAANNTAGEPTTMAHTPDGLASEMVEPVLADGTQHRQTSFGHDILGRVTLEEVALVGAGAASSPAKAYTWTTLGQRATEVGRDGTVQSFTYNAASQLTGASEDAHARSVSAGYYLNGWLRATSSAVAGSPGQSRHQKIFYWGDGLEGWRFFGSDPTFATTDSIQGFVYNDARAMSQVLAVGWGLGWDTWNVANDRAGRPLTMTDPPNGGAPARTTTFDRNADGTIAERTLHSGGAGTSVIDEWAYTYDATGRVASRNRSGGAGSLNEVLGYDEAGRLSTINSNPVSYDPNGNRLSGPGMPTQTFRADNAIATGPGANGNGTEAYQYTPWGGLTRDACKTYNYDGFDRAHKTTLRQNLDLVPRCNALGDLLRANDEKRYDPLGRNVWARHDRLSVLGEPTLTEYQNLYPVGLGQDIAYEHTVGDADRSGRYVNTPDGTPLAVTDLNGDYQFLHRDGQGNTVAAINPGGSVACGPELDPWGEGADECDDLLNPETPNRKWYNSSRLDTTTETYQWGTRTYNPETATWQQPDTASLTGAPDNVSIGTDPLVANRYAYVNGDPINYTDPTGHRLCAAINCRDRERDAYDRAKQAEVDELLQGWEPGESILAGYEACIADFLSTARRYNKSRAVAERACSDIAPSSAYEHAASQCQYAEYQCMVAFLLDLGFDTDRIDEITPVFCDPVAPLFVESTGCDRGTVHPDFAANFVLIDVPSGLLAGGLLRGGVSLLARSGARVATTGQEHHVISRRIAAALDDHPTLAGQYTPRDPRFVTQAIDDAAHRGYQTWHRQLDAEVADWLARNPNATTNQFEQFLGQRYARPDLAQRFPNGF